MRLRPMAPISLIDSVEDLDRLIAASEETPVWILKHSLTCGISASARQEYQRFAAGQPEGAGLFGLIEIQAARPVSDTLAERTGVPHESPQAVLLRRGRAAWHGSHGGIRAAALAAAAAAGAAGRAE